MLSAFLETVGTLGILASIVTKITAIRLTRENSIKPRDQAGY